MSDQDNQKNKREDELQKAIKKAGSKSFGVKKGKEKDKKGKDSADSGKSVMDTLEELESRYVTRPAQVSPPLPPENPDSIKRSGVQKRYDPRDKTQFPEESAYDMKPFILEENRLTPKDEEPRTKTLSDPEPPESPANKSKKPDLFGDEFDSYENNMDLLGEDSIYEMEPIILPGYELNPKEDVEEDDALEEDDSQDTEAPNQNIEPGVDPTGDVQLFPEQSQFELTPIVIDREAEEAEENDDEAEAGKADAEESRDDVASAVSEIAEEVVAEQEQRESQEPDKSVLEPGLDPLVGMDPLPEDSIYEMEPIRIPHQEPVSKVEEEDEDWDLSESPHEDTHADPREDNDFPESSGDYIEPGLDPLSPMERLPEDSIYELEPIVIPNQEKLAEKKSAKDVGDSDWDSGSEEALRKGDTLLEGVPIYQEGLSAEPLTLDQEELPVEAEKKQSHSYSPDLEETAAMQEFSAGPVEMKRGYGKESDLDFDSPDLAETMEDADVHIPGEPLHEAPDTVARRLPGWEDTEDDRPTPRFTAPLISLAKDNRAPGSEIETAAIAKEIATHQSMSAVKESRIQRALDQDPTASGARQRPGHTLEDKYLITGIIGQGGISVVYKARDLATNQIVAVKTLKENKPDIAVRFKREIETLTKLQHKNIVRAVEAITLPPSQTFLVMEHVKGISLQELIKQYGRAEHPEVIASILTQVCDGLAHAHKHKIIHRDLKGGNIVLTNVSDKIVVKILDFGIAKLEDDMQKLTLEGKAMGSPLFMSPEQCKGETLTVRSDLYSLGIVAYELIAGELPVKGRSIVDVMAKHCDVNYRPKPLSEVRPELPGVGMLDQIILKALETEVTERLKSIEQFKAGIEFWIEAVREQDLNRVIPSTMLESQDAEELEANRLKESISDLYEARNEALKTGVSFTAVKEERERAKRSWLEQMKADGKLKPFVITASLVVALLIVIAVLAANLNR